MNLPVCRTLSSLIFLISSLFLISCSLNEKVQCAEGACSTQLKVTSQKNTITVNSTLQIDVEGGEAPYTYSVISGGGSVSSSGLFTAPNAPGECVIEVKDVNDLSYRITITVNPSMSLSASVKVSAEGVGENWDVNKYISGGVPPYSYSIQSGPGQIDSDGFFTTPSTWNDTVINVTDSEGTVVSMTVVNRPSFFNGTVNKILELNESLYIAGGFDTVYPKSVANFAIIESANGNIADTPCNWNTRIKGSVKAVLKDGDDLYIGGYISHYNGAPSSTLIKVKASTCEIVPEFTQDGGFTRSIEALAVDQNFIYVGFNGYENYRGNTPQALAKVRKDNGNLDTTFTQDLSGIADQFDGPGDISGMVYYNNSLYVIGWFDKYRGATAKNLAKIDVTTGNLDTTFTQATGLSSSGNAILLANNSIYVAGSFGSYRGNASGGRVAKLDPISGDLDTTFNSAIGFNGTVFNIAASNDSLYALGQFSTYRGVTAERFAKIDLVNGDMDTTFTQPTGFLGIHNGLAYLNGAVYLGGGISTYRGTSVKDILKVDALTGDIDTNFTKNEGFNSGLVGIYAASNQIYAYGTFSLYRGQHTGGLVKMDKNTFELDWNFINNANLSSVNDIVSDGTNIYAASGPKGVTKLNALTGAVDSGYISGAGSSWGVNKLALANSSLYLAGTLTSFSGSTAQSVAKIDLVNGNLDTTFTQATGFNHWVQDIQADATHLYVAGYFSQYRGTTVQRLAKLNLTTGALDTTFSTASGFNSTVNALYLDGSNVIAAGDFWQYRGVNVGGLARLNKTNGNMDTTFSQATGFPPGFPPKKIIKKGTSYYIGGQFYRYRGIDRPGMIKIDEVNGNLDSSFSNTSGFSSNQVLEIFDTGTDLLVGGGFTYLLDNPANFFVRINSDSGAPQ